MAQPTLPSGRTAPKWQPFEVVLYGTGRMQNPVQEAQLITTFTSPAGQRFIQPGFWDGGHTWRVRFSPNVEGTWQYSTVLLHMGTRLQEESGSFNCLPPLGETIFDHHGPVQMAQNRRYLIHEDGTPFFWLADTAWNGPLRATDEEWDHYIQARVRQGFTAVQWVTTQWRAAPDGDSTGNLAYHGRKEIAINPLFFQRLDWRIETLKRAGLLSVPVLLWANPGGEQPEVNPGIDLPEDQAVLLARYMVARWGASPAVWILPGDGRYEGETAARWRRIGRAVFENQQHAPVAIHCAGQHFPVEEFRDEAWMDILGYQSGHGDSDETLQWIVSGPPMQEWQKPPHQFAMNLEPAYENHVSYHNKMPHSAHSVRMAIYWSLLNAPTAGVTYGGHGIWGWDDGSAPPVDHPRSGIPLPWQEALTMPAAEQMVHLKALFTALDWWRLRPDPQLLAEQPGEQDVHDHILAVRTEEGDLALFYTPTEGSILLRTAKLVKNLHARWLNPTTGESTQAEVALKADTCRVYTPDAGDWILVLEQAEKNRRE